MANQVFVSPGVFTSELDLTYVTRQVGVTSLGLVGETTQGPAFQPIFVSNYSEFQSFFGGLNNTLVNGPDGNGAPLYELPYIAKSYLSQSNQLFVTRVLGYSGYHAGQAWGITLNAALDPATTATTYSNNTTATYSASTGGTVYSITTSDPVINAYFAVSPISFATLGTVNTGTTINIAIPQTKTGLVFNGGSIGMTITNTGSTPNVVLSTTLTPYSGSNYAFIYTANTTTGSIVAISSNDDLINFYAAQRLDNFSYVLGTTGQKITPVAPIFINNDYTGGTITTTTVSTGSTTGSLVTGSTTGSTILVTGYNAYNLTGTTSNVSYTYSGSGYSDVEGKIIALVRSRATVPASTQLPAFQITGTTNLGLDSTITGATVNPFGTFSITGNSNTQGSFSYSLTFDDTQKNYVPRALGKAAFDKKTAIFLEEFYGNLFTDDNNSGKILGINPTLVQYGTSFNNYLQQYQPAVTPYVVSEVKGNKVLRLFRFWTISDGNAANSQIKISIANIRPDTLEFDVQIRSFSDTDARPQILESFSRCTMDVTSNKYIGRLIGTLDGTYASNSSYVLVEIDDNSDTSDSFPAGFVGYPVRNYQSNGNSSVQTPDFMYKNAYGTYDNPRKYYLGVSDTVGIDNDFFAYKGVPPQGLSYSQWTGLTSGYHMDINASAVTIDDITEYLNGASGATYQPIFNFTTGIAPFQSEAGVVGTQYAQLYARKFTFVPSGGFDGWDIYRTRRSNLDSYAANGRYGVSFAKSNLAPAGPFSLQTLQDGTIGTTSDYYAYQDAIWTFKNSEAVNINIFATPGIDTFDNQELVSSTIEMIENDRADSLYIVTTPDADSTGTPYSIGTVAEVIGGNFDSNYTATYWPWIQILDSENNAYVYLPATRDVVTNAALTDNIAFPWYAIAGVNRGAVNCIKARTKLTQADRDLLCENRINPIATYTSSGVVIWGNLTMQVADTYLKHINIRRLLLQARKLISAVSIRLLFEQNDSIVRNQFLSLVNPILDNIRTERGLTDFRVVVNNSPEDIDNNQLTGMIYLKPTTALEFIQIQFTVMNNGASFANV